MKIVACPTTTRQQGMAVIALVALMAIILIFVAANVRTVHLLRSDLRTIERRQTNHWANARLGVNAPTNTNTTARLPGERGINLNK